jgi:hypothetical protein
LQSHRVAVKPLAADELAREPFAAFDAWLARVEQTMPPMIADEFPPTGGRAPVADEADLGLTEESTDVATRGAPASLPVEASLLLAGRNAGAPRVVHSAHCTVNLMQTALPDSLAPVRRA